MKRRIESFDKPNEETVKLIGELISVLNRDEKEAVFDIIKQYTAEPIEDYDAAISELKDFSRFIGRSISRPEKIELSQSIAKISV